MMADDGISFLNVGSGREISIYDLVALVAKVVGYQGDVFWDGSKPEGNARKLLDTTRLKQLGWRPAIALEEGIRQVYQDYCG